MPRSQTYANNSYNRSVGRVGMPMGSCVISRGSSNGGCGGGGSYGGYSTGSTGSPGSYGLNVGSSSGGTKTYVDNAYNRRVGRVDMPVGSCVISKSRSGGGDSGGSFGYHSASSVSYVAKSVADISVRTYVNNASNRRIGRVGEPVGTMPVSKTSYSPTSSSHEHSETKTYVDNAYNRKHGRVGLPVGTAVVSKNGSMSRASERPVTSGADVRVYVDNPFNRRLGRVGKTVGTMVYSRKSNSSDGKPSVSMRTYVDNAANRRLGRVGKPLGCMPSSRKSKDTVSTKEWIDKIQRDDEEVSYSSAA